MENESQSFGKWIKGVPFMTRFIVLSLILTSALRLWGVSFPERMVLRIENIVKDYQVQRMVLSCLHEPILPVCLVIILVYCQFFPKFEVKNSTPVLMMDYIVNGMGQAAIFAIIGIAYYFLTEHYPNAFLGSLCICLNFLYKYSNGNSQHKAPFLIVGPSINLKFHPWLIYIICCLLSAQVRYDGLLGLAMGVLQCYFFYSGCILFSVDTYGDKQYYAQKVGLTSLDCWQNVNVDQIKVNERLTVPSQQFYRDVEVYERGTLATEQEATIKNSNREGESQMSQEIHEQNMA